MSLLFPNKCILCGKILDRNETDLCHACRVDSPECPVRKQKRTFLDSWVAIWYYKGYIRSSILRYKFRGARSYADVYGRLLAMKLAAEYPDGFDLLTWVPISFRRKWARGYDQVELLARSVGRELGMKPVRCLRKIRHNRPQAGISGEAQRRANVLGVYRVAGKTDLRGKRVLLLDDVITTGTTLDECAKMLKIFGAEEVYAVTAAAACLVGRSSGRLARPSLPTPIPMAPEDTKMTSCPAFFRSDSTLHRLSTRRMFRCPVE